MHNACLLPNFQQSRRQCSSGARYPLLPQVIVVLTPPPPGAAAAIDRTVSCAAVAASLKAYNRPILGSLRLIGTGILSVVRFAVPRRLSFTVTEPFCKQEEGRRRLPSASAY